MMKLLRECVIIMYKCLLMLFNSKLFSVFFSSRRRHTRCALVTGVQTCALPICPGMLALVPEHLDHEVGGAVYHFRLVREVPGRVHEAGQLHHPLQDRKSVV